MLVEKLFPNQNHRQSNRFDRKFAHLMNDGAQGHDVYTRAKQFEGLTRPKN
jgi:hypothetical protein